MSTVTFKTQTVFAVEECCACAILFAVPEKWQENKRGNHKTFYCPNGHAQSYQSITPLEEAKAQIESLQGNLAATKQNAKYWHGRSEEHERSKNAYKGHLTRAKKRVGNGVCPCCNRSFTNLKRHMHTKHPDYTAGPAS